MPKKHIPTLMLAMMVILIVLAIITVLPFGTSKANDMGYISTCTFAPWSTLMLLLGAGVFWAVRNYILTSID